MASAAISCDGSAWIACRTRCIRGSFSDLLETNTSVRHVETPACNDIDPPGRRWRLVEQSLRLVAERKLLSSLPSVGQGTSIARGAGCSTLTCNAKILSRLNPSDFGREVTKRLTAGDNGNWQPTTDNRLATGRFLCETAGHDLGGTFGRSTSTHPNSCVQNQTISARQPYSA